MYYKAITVKYLPCTNNRGSRVKATAEGGHSVTLSWDYGLEGMSANRDAAVRALCTKLGWTGEYVAGYQGNGHWVYVEVDRWSEKISIGEK